MEALNAASTQHQMAHARHSPGVAANAIGMEAAGLAVSTPPPAAHVRNSLNPAGSAVAMEAVGAAFTRRPLGHVRTSSSPTALA